MTWTDEEQEGEGIRGGRNPCLEALRHGQVEAFEQLGDNGCFWSAGCTRAELHPRARAGGFAWPLGALGPHWRSGRSKGTEKSLSIRVTQCDIYI